MKNYAKLLTLGLFSIALAAGPVVTSVYAAPDDPPPSDRRQEERRRERSCAPASKQNGFAAGYRAAYAAIYDRGEYASAIEQLKALHRDDSAAVANLIGYSYRKLGDYKVSQIWYERALKADPSHVKTWQYYGLWQVEQGNRDQAQYHLSRIAALAGTAKRRVPLARRRAGEGAGHRPRLLIAAIDTQTGAAATPRRFCFVIARASLHQRLHLAAKRLPCALARIEHVPARIDREFDAVGAGIGRQLVERDPRCEIGRGEIEQPVRRPAASASDRAPATAADPRPTRPGCGRDRNSRHCRRRR